MGLIERDRDREKNNERDVERERYKNTCQISMFLATLYRNTGKLMTAHKVGIVFSERQLRG